MEQYNDLQDWELLQSPDSTPDVASVVASGSGIDYDYFVVGSGGRGQGRRAEETDLEVGQGGLEEKDEEKFQADRGELEVGSEEGSRIEVGFDGVEDSLENLSDLGGNDEGGVRQEVLVGEEEEEGSGVVGVGEGNEERSGNSEELSFGEQSEVDLDGVEFSRENLSGSGGDGGGYVGKGETDEVSDVVGIVEEVKADADVLGIIEEIEANTDNSDWDFVQPSGSVPKAEFAGRNMENSEPGNVSVGNGNKSEVVWWKLPLEFVKFCIFKVKPIWTISLAAAMVGFALIGRRWYNMKRRSQSIPVRLGINDKKASQSVVRASQLNEAFFSVKHVPLLKTSISNSGITPWPAMALI